MMEELVGKLWHHLITRAASIEHEQARVHQSEIRKSIEVLFRAAGGSPLIRLREAVDQKHGGPRNWLQRVAGSGTHSALPSIDMDSLSLPSSIAVFADRQLNVDLYFWLAALAACHHDSGNWIEDNLWATCSVWAMFPGLRSRHARLLQQHMAQRPQPTQLKGAAQQAEACIQRALTRSPGEPPVVNQQEYRQITANEAAPVWLWIHPSTSASSAVPRKNPSNGDSDGPAPASQIDRKRRQAHRTENATDRNGMMMFFRAESIMSWSEYVKVNRQTDDDDDGQALKAADDMSSLAITEDGQTSAARVKFDLDLPAASEDDAPLGPGVHLPEWHWKKQAMLAEHCCAQLLETKSAPPYLPTDELRLTTKRVRRKLEVVRALPRHLHAQPQGEELDLDAWVQWQTQGGPAARVDGLARIYSQRQAQERSMACLLLADLSLSTDAWANNEQRIIDVIRDSLYVFGEALNALCDPFAMLGFSSVRRQNVRMHLLKRFNESWNPMVQARVGAIKPGYYTRMGAAIRYAIKGMKDRPERQRVLMILTDGKPNDLDIYEGRYGLEDTRQAILEARAEGLLPFCVTIDQEAHDYLPHLFGHKGFAVVHRPADLVSRLTTAYAKLTTPFGSR